jgi:FkbM family methyltransferase
MSTQQKLIDLVRAEPPNLSQAIAALLNSEQHNLGQINEILYSLLLVGEYKVAYALASMLHSQGLRTHAISLSQILTATVSEDVELQRDWVKSAQSQYACIWPKPRKQLMNSIIRPLVSKIQTDELTDYQGGIGRFLWLLNITHPDFHSVAYEAPLFSVLTGHDGSNAKIVDIGASNIGWPPPYQPMLESGATLIGFEPSETAFKKLVADAEPNHIYLKAAVGDGSPKALNFFWDPGMTSCLLPNEPVLDMFLPYDCKVTASERVDTTRLDDITEIGEVDLLKMDIQGFELEVLNNAVSKLEKTLVIDIEVSFVQMYQGQPLFADIDLFLRQQGFQFHRFNYDADPALEGTEIQTVGPSWMASGTGLISYNRGQVLWADAIYVRDYNQLDKLSNSQLLSMARVLHDCYQSYDLVQHLLTEYDQRLTGSFSENYITGCLLH